MNNNQPHSNEPVNHLHPKTGEPQICYEIDGMMLCNFIVRNGNIIYSKQGKMMRFPTGRKRKKTIENDITQEKKKRD